jgi:hypothetical protein
MEIYERPHGFLFFNESLREKPQVWWLNQCCAVTMLCYALCWIVAPPHQWDLGDDDAHIAEDLFASDHQGNSLGLTNDLLYEHYSTSTCFL